MPTKKRTKTTAVEGIRFAFFGAGDASYYEQASLAVVFRTAVSPAKRRQLERGIPKPLVVERWVKRTLLLATDDYAFAGVSNFDAFNTAIERWLVERHAIAPIDFAFRAPDSEADTRFSTWHERSMTMATALLRDLKKRYDDDETRAHVRKSLLAMMDQAGIAVPAKLAPTRGWRDALDAGDAKTFGPLIARHTEDLQVVLDPRNANHRRALLGARPRLEREGLLDTRIFAMAVLDHGADAMRVIEVFLKRARKKPFWATSCSTIAAEYVKDAPKSALAILDRLVELDTAHPIVVENALWAAIELGLPQVERERLAKYWSVAVEKLAAWPGLYPYLEKLASVIGRDMPARPVPQSQRTRRRR